MAAPRPALPLRVVIASDAKRGHENQSRVIARILGDNEPLVLYLRPRIAELPLRLRLRLLGRDGISQLRAAEIVRRSLQPERPEVFRAFAHDYRQAQGKLRLFCVSTGTAPATYNLVLARMLQAASIVNMTPSLLPRRLFDLNIVPEHDVEREHGLPANVITTPLALGYHDSQAAQALASRLAREYGFAEQGDYLGVCIGGPTPDIPYPAAWCDAFMHQLLNAAERLGQRLLITTSRRTPARDIAAIAAAIQANPHAAFFLDAHSDPLNPLPAFYELSRAMVITADSYSMVSESIHAGHKPLVLVPPSAKRHAKVLRSLRRLDAKDLLSLHPASTRDEATQFAAQISLLPPRREANTLYEQLRDKVRVYLSLD
jgi:mitochondrial fission protein ELM1